MNKHLRRSCSDCSIENFAIPYSKRLPWHRWAESDSLAYLNVIDNQLKTYALKEIPWFYIPYTEEEIQKYSQLNVFSEYKIHILDKIAKSDKSLIAQIIRSVLYVCNLYSLILDPDLRTCLCIDVIHLLHEKNFDDPASFFTLCNLLCGKSNKTKICFLSTLIDRYHDKKTIIILRYILQATQAARFNLWGIWFNENEKDSVTFCPVTWALIKGNVDLLNLLLQYGFEQNSGRVCIYDKNHQHIENIIYSWLKAPLEENSGRSAILTEVLFFLIQFSKVKSKSKLKSLEKCFHLLWSINTIPFVTESELMNEVHRRFENPPRRLHSCPYTYIQFINLVEYYKQVKPLESNNDIQPRSLQQLCKSVVRRTLARAYNLPQGIKKLPLPKKLQDTLKIY